MADPAWTARVITLFPEMFPGPLGHSLTGRALADGLWRLEARQLRDSATDRHRSVDDTPAGGGAGMVLRADVAAAALNAADSGRPRADWPVLYLSPRGRPFDQARARDCSVTLHVDRGNPALGWYEHMGFTVKAHSDPLYLLMEWTPQ